MLRLVIITSRPRLSCERSNGRRRKDLRASQRLEAHILVPRHKDSLATREKRRLHRGLLRTLKRTKSTAGLRRRKFNPANGPQVAQYQGASSCETAWFASSRVSQPLLADPRASNWRAGRRREFLFVPFLQALDLKRLATAARSSRVALVQRCRHSKE